MVWGKRRRHPARVVGCEEIEGIVSIMKTYSIHAYVTDENGIQSFVGGMKRASAKPPVTILQKKRVIRKNIDAVRRFCSGGIKSIKYAVWSEKTDGTILSGMKVKRRAAIYTASKAKNHKSLGTYIVREHAAKTGKMIILQANTFSVQSPKSRKCRDHPGYPIKTATVKVSGIMVRVSARSPGSGLVCSGSERY